MNFIDFLRTRLTGSLPGNIAHLEMAPSIKGKPYRKFAFEHEPLRSAVLIILFQDKNGEIEILFTKRSSELNNHSGQISFPGGRSEGNENPVETALRETNEETGIKSNLIEILGQLSELYVPPSNSNIFPVVSLILEKPDLKLNKAEVEEAFWVNLDEFIQEDKIKNEKWNFRGTMVDVPFWRVHPTTPLWGATAMILMELVFLFREYSE